MIQHFNILPRQDGVLIRLTSDKEMFFPNITEEQMDKVLNDYYIVGLPIQNAFPFLNPDQREFLQTGIASEEWEEIFGGEE